MANDAKDGKKQEIYSTKERRDLQSKVLEKYREMFHPKRDEPFNNISYDAFKKMCHTVGGDLRKIVGTDEFSDTPKIKYGVPLINWSNEALKLIEPFFKDVKIDENIITDKERIVTHLEHAFKKRYPHKKKSWSERSVKVRDFYDELMMDTALETIPNLGKHKALSTNTPISKLSLEAVEIIKTALKIGA